MKNRLDLLYGVPFHEPYVYASPAVDPPSPSSLRGFLMRTYVQLAIFAATLFGQPIAAQTRPQSCPGTTRPTAATFDDAWRAVFTDAFCAAQVATQPTRYVLWPADSTTLTAKTATVELMTPATVNGTPITPAALEAAFRAQMPAAIQALAAKGAGALAVVQLKHVASGSDSVIVTDTARGLTLRARYALRSRQTSPGVTEPVHSLYIDVRWAR